jgi:general secretion pathway protein A
MYLDFYQLRERPFNVTADPKFLYLNACYREALASLQYGISQRKGFITLIGEAGTGKTTLLKKLLDDLDANTRTVFLFNTNVSFDEILEYVFHEFDLPVHNGKRLYMLQRLNAFLLDELRQGRNVALLIDEAQDLDFSVLEDLRLLSNLETAKEKILQIVLSGQPELGQKLGNPSLRQLRQRIAINCRLQPLARDEISEYVQARFVAAGAADLKLFSRDAEDRIFEISRGIPRVVNVICDNALVIGYALGKKRIGGDVIEEASADLFPPEPEEPPRAAASEAAPGPVEVPPARGWRASQVGMIAVVAGAILIGLLSVGRSLLRREAVPAAGTTAVQRSRDVVPPGERLASAAGPVRRGAERSAAPVIGPRIVDAAPEGGSGQTTAPRPEAVRREPEPAPPPPVDDAVVVAEPPVLAAAPPAAAPAVVPAAPRVEAKTALAPKALARAPLPVAREPESAALPPPAPELVAAARPVVEPVVAAPAPAVAPAAPPAVEREEPKALPAAKPLEAAVAAPWEAPAPRTDAGAVAAPVAAVAPRVFAPASAPPAPSSARTTVMPDEAAVDDLEPVEIPEEPDAAVREAAPPAEDPATTESARGDSEAAPARTGRDTKADEDRQLALAVSNSQSVTARPGDSVSGIAIRKYGVASHTILDLMKLANPEIRDIDEISAGQELKLPQLDQGLALLADHDGRYALLLLSTPHQRRANAIEAGLRRHGVHTEVRRTDFGRGQLVYRLIVPNLSDREQALRVGRQLQRLLREDASLATVAR